MTFKTTQFCGWASVVFAFTINVAAQTHTPSTPEVHAFSATAVKQQEEMREIASETRITNTFSSFGPYKGAVVRDVDTQTLVGKVMCGYQGWFGTPGDGSAGHNWRHWTKHHGPMEDGNAKVDLWPDVSELSPSERFPTGFKMANGRPAEVFSSYAKPTVLRHFQWMQDYGIDGVFVQRFAVELHDQNNLEHCNTVLANCREGANLHGRTYAVMYDLSGLPAGHIEEVMNDWRELRKQMTITADPAYLHQGGKPVVVVWGIGFNDHREYTLAECRRLIEFLKGDIEAGGCTVMIGVPAYWRELNRDAVNDPKLLEVIGMADIVSPWTVGRYTDVSGAANYAKNTLTPDLAWCRQHKIDYMPVAFPGFSWYNMNGREFNIASRSHGQFLWSQILGAKQAGASMVYVAMFDEVDEGTAIFKCINNVPVGRESKFLSFEGLPSDYYLKLVGAGVKLIQGKMPIEAAKNMTAALSVFHPDNLDIDSASITTMPRITADK
ncbi:MAG: hypothetical protein JWR19_2712 [Pedosphaera sp.]|nr:hypothetical protein [Pedosphaera sp.]